VVFPVAPVSDKAGTFVDWEGRLRPFDNIFRNPSSLPDLRVLAGVAEEMGVDLGFRTVTQAREEMSELGPWDGARASAPTVPAAPAPLVADGEAVLASWKLLIDDGRMLDGDEDLLATARKAVALVSPGTLATLGLVAGQPVVEVADLPDDVVWAPASSGGVSLLRDLGAGAGSVVRLQGGTP
jgi:NADH-quinone oxidoreductase subunit G